MKAVIQDPSAILGRRPVIRWHRSTRHVQCRCNRNDAQAASPLAAGLAAAVLSGASLMAPLPARSEPLAPWLPGDGTYVRLERSKIERILVEEFEYRLHKLSSEELSVLLEQLLLHRELNAPALLSKAEDPTYEPPPPPVQPSLSEAAWGKLSSFIKSNVPAPSLPTFPSLPQATEEGSAADAPDAAGSVVSSLSSSMDAVKKSILASAESSSKDSQPAASVAADTAKLSKPSTRDAAPLDSPLSKDAGSTNSSTPSSSSLQARRQPDLPESSPTQPAAAVIAPPPTTTTAPSAAGKPAATSSTTSAQPKASQPDVAEADTPAGSSAASAASSRLLSSRLTRAPAQQAAEQPKQATAADASEPEADADDSELDLTSRLFQQQGQIKSPRTTSSDTSTTATPAPAAAADSATTIAGITLPSLPKVDLPTLPDLQDIAEPVGQAAQATGQVLGQLGEYVADSVLGEDAVEELQEVVLPRLLLAAGLAAGGYAAYQLLLPQLQGTAAAAGQPGTADSSAAATAAAGAGEAPAAVDSSAVQEQMPAAAPVAGSSSPWPATSKAAQKAAKRSRLFDNGLDEQAGRALPLLSVLPLAMPPAGAGDVGVAGSAAGAEAGGDVGILWVRDDDDVPAASAEGAILWQRNDDDGPAAVSSSGAGLASAAAAAAAVPDPWGTNPVAGSMAVGQPEQMAEALAADLTVSPWDAVQAADGSAAASAGGVAGADVADAAQDLAGSAR